MRYPFKTVPFGTIIGLSLILTMVTLGFALPAFAQIEYFDTGSATLVVEDGQLTGATNVLVTDLTGLEIGYYDVTFVEDSAFNLFSSGSGTQGSYDFGAVTSKNMARYFTEALLASVLINIDNDHKFDNDPSLTWGITVSNLGYIFTAYDVVDEDGDGDSSDYASNILVYQVLNYNNLGVDTFKSNQSFGATWDTSNYGQDVYAVWKASASVPIPDTLFLLGMGLISVCAARRRENG